MAIKIGYIFNRIILMIYFLLNIGISLDKLSMQINNSNGEHHNIIEQGATETENHVYEILDIVNEVREISIQYSHSMTKGRISVC